MHDRALERLMASTEASTMLATLTAIVALVGLGRKNTARIIFSLGVVSEDTLYVA